MIFKKSDFYLLLVSQFPEGFFSFFSWMILGICRDRYALMQSGATPDSQDFITSTLTSHLHYLSLRQRILASLEYHYSSWRWGQSIVKHTEWQVSHFFVLWAKVSHSGEVYSPTGKVSEYLLWHSSQIQFKKALSKLCRPASEMC